MTEESNTSRLKKSAKPRADGNGRAMAARPRVTKKSQLIRLLRHKNGADVAAISRKLGWQPHTTRAALTGLRKAGYGITAEKSGDGKPARYRITTAPSVAAG